MWGKQRAAAVGHEYCSFLALSARMLSYFFLMSFFKSAKTKDSLRHRESFTKSSCSCLVLVQDNDHWFSGWSNVHEGGWLIWCERIHAKLCGAESADCDWGAKWLRGRRGSSSSFSCYPFASDVALRRCSADLAPPVHQAAHWRSVRGRVFPGSTNEI